MTGSEYWGRVKSFVYYVMMKVFRKIYRVAIEQKINNVKLQRMVKYSVSNILHIVD